MVTDSSDTVFNFSFTTLKPGIFFDPFKTISHVEEIGERVYTLSELLKKTDFVIKNLEKYKEKIKNFRDSYIENLEKSGEYLIENIDYILTDKKHPEWNYF